MVLLHPFVFIGNAVFVFEPFFNLGNIKW